ncbi:MAG TPA: folate-binding protein [Acidisarcina sp.]
MDCFISLLAWRGLRLHYALRVAAFAPALQADVPSERVYNLPVASTTSASEELALQPADASLTPLASLLVSEKGTLPIAVRGGAQSFAHFGDPAAELSTLLYSVGLCDLGFRTRISVTGEDKFRWLNGMVTNAVSTLGQGKGNYNFVLNAQGRIQGDAYVFHEHDGLLIETDRSQAGRLLEHLNRFIIMDDVELADLSSRTTALGLVGPGAATLLARLGFGPTLEELESRSASICGVAVTVVRGYGPLAPRFELWADPSKTSMLWQILTAAGGRAVGLAAQDSLRVLEGTPLYGIDIQERNLVQETGQTRALNFTKGCYLGQEIVERIRSRTTVNRFLRQFELKGAVPEAGVELRSPGEERAAGSFTSVATYMVNGLPAALALGYIRREVLDSGFAIEYEGGTARVLASPPAIPVRDV